MTDAVFGAIDQGTTSTRAIRMDASGRPSVVMQRRHRMRRPRPGWVEMDGAELLANVAACADALGGATALGLANQGESCIAWHAESKAPLSPVLSWQDQRGAGVLDRLRADGHAPEVERRSGLPLDTYFSASKLAWLCAEMPDVAAAGASGRLRLGTTDSFFLDALAGIFATDRATASRTGLMDMEGGEWDPALCALYGVSPGALPPIRPNLSDFGAIAGVPVTASIVDQQAALYGHGCRAGGDAKFTFGTGGFALALRTGRDALPSGSGLLPTVAWDLGQGSVMALDGGVPDVGTLVDWAVASGLAPGPEALGRDGVLRAEAGLVALPVFSGLGCPDWDRGAVPLIVGMSPATKAIDIATAVLEGAAFLCARVLGAMAPYMPDGRAVRVDGGVAANDHFLQIMADLGGTALLRVAETERTGLGAAMLAARGAGHEIDPPAAGGKTLFAPRPLAPEVSDRFETALAMSRARRSN